MESVRIVNSLLRNSLLTIIKLIVYSVIQIFTFAFYCSLLSFPMFLRSAVAPHIPIQSVKYFNVYFCTGMLYCAHIHNLQIQYTIHNLLCIGFLGSKITADGDCSHEIKRHLLLGRKVTTNLDNILKSRNITLPTKVHLVKAMVFPVVMYGCEIWTVKKAEC